MAGDNPWLQMAAKAGIQLQSALADKGYQNPEDIRAKRTDQLLQDGVKQYNEESKKPGADPNEIQSRLVTDAYYKFLNAGDVQSAGILAPHVFAALQQKAELAKLQGTDLASTSKRTLDEAKQALDEKQAAETERHNRAEEARQKAIEKQNRTQLIQTVDPNDPEGKRTVWKLVDAHTGETINPDVGQVAPKAAAAAAGRIQAQAQRILGSADLATKSLENLTKLTIDTDRGIFGSAEPGKTLSGSTLSVLGNAVTSKGSQRYRALISGVQRNLATIEAQGSAQGLAGLTSKMDSIVAIPGDDYLTQVTKLAEIRQIVEEGMKTYLTNPGLSDDQRALAQKLIDRAEAAVPYTQDDITELQYSKDKTLTLDKIVAKRRASDSQPATGGAADYVFNPKTGKLEPAK